MPIHLYLLVPADGSPAIPPVNIPDEMYPTSKTDSDDLQCMICRKVYKNKKSLSDHKRRYHCDDLQCKICRKVYKNKKSLGDHNRRYHSNIPLRLYPDQQQDFSKSQPIDEGSEIDTDGSNVNTSTESKKHYDKSWKRRFHDTLNSDTDLAIKKSYRNESRKIKRVTTDSQDSDDNRMKRRASYSKDGSSNSDSETNLYRTSSYEKRKRDRSSSIDVSRTKINGKRSQNSPPRIRAPSRKRSISPDTARIIKKLKRNDKEESVRRKLRRERKIRQRKVRKRLRRKVVNPTDIEPLNTDEEVDNDSKIIIV